ncbi:hypothetical protein [Thiolapillus sp.]|uniref:hypothetical protein n=1 Tax=Thiolapillus sp. TaxID=2017437 RepID=UPI0025FBC39E|nr:hypothetical protein [Thiolapillus sp.]
MLKKAGHLTGFFIPDQVNVSYEQGCGSGVMKLAAWTFKLFGLAVADSAGV